MARKTDIDVIKENWLIIAFSVWFILTGIFIAVLPHLIEPVSYDDYQTKVVTVKSLGYRSVGGRVSGYYFMRTTDGEKYNISGIYNKTQLKKMITKGRTVTIKWVEDEWLKICYAEEIFVDGEKVVSYDGDSWGEGKGKIFVFVFGICMVAIGTGGLFILKLLIKSNRKKRQKREEQLLKKYGKLK